MADIFDPYYEWLGIPPAEQPPHHYRLLGLGPFEENADVIANASDRQMGHLRGFAAGKHSHFSQKLLNEVAAARVCLLNADKKAEYDALLRQQLAVPMPPIPRATPVASAVTPVGTGLPHVATDYLEADSPLPAYLSRSKPMVVTVGAAAAFVLLASLVWWLSGLGKSPQPDPSGTELAQAELADPSPDPAAVGTLPTTDPVEPSPEQPEPEQPEPTHPTPSDPLPTDPEPALPPMTETPDKPTEEPEQPDVPRPDSPEGPMVESPDEPVPAEIPAEPGPATVPSVQAEETPPPSMHVTRKPVPSAAEQQEVRRVLDETYDTGAARNPTERMALVDQLVGLIEAGDDASERFVLLRRASELASDAGEGERMMRLVGQIADEFDVDRLRVQAAMLEGLSKKVATEDQIGVLVQVASPVIDEALTSGRFDLADSLSAAVYRTCQATAGRAFRVEALNRRRKVQEQRGLWDEMQAARVTLQANPDDEAASLAMGRWFCFVREDWEQGAPHLAKGSQPELKALAARDLSATALEPSAQVELADAWWDMGSAATDPRAKMAQLRRATHWYRQAQPELPSTLLKAKVAKRLDEFAKLNQTETPQTASGPPPAVAPFDAQQATQHQQVWAKHLNAPLEEVNPIGMRMRLIPPGEFMMGSKDGPILASPRYTVGLGGRLVREHHQPEAPVHRVRITQPFWIGITEVTQEQFFRVMGANPSRNIVPALPVDRVSWAEAMEFCRRLTQTLGKKLGGRVYRLPTEAEWEYACRAGTTTTYSFGEDEALITESAWFLHNSNGRLQPVGGRKPNPWGLYDMHGNAIEWVLDWASADYYSVSPLDDPVGPPTGVTRVGRGGSCETSPTECRSAARNLDMPQYRRYYAGFRVVLGSPDILTKMLAPSTEEPEMPDSETRRSGEGMIPGMGASDLEATAGEEAPSADGMAPRRARPGVRAPQPTEGTFDHLERMPPPTSEQ
ncbi:MAG: SUMF1/EgtB/PvdO family nonheme iron enzyme [Patescibacteria group bacterium]|nr:SUMF1/EgtB/PvdO family nonheme iron enzyme [Patescibacteria group bacterium]